ncbi:MAG: hypothetical protein AzoDbin1_04634, partial [Azoarcus sp.]|nr:hypothetical protein [Azoarcus sp.]
TRYGRWPAAAMPRTTSRPAWMPPRAARCKCPTAKATAACARWCRTPCSPRCATPAWPGACTSCSGRRTGHRDRPCPAGRRTARGRAARARRQRRARDRGSGFLAGARGRRAAPGGRTFRRLAARRGGGERVRRPRRRGQAAGAGRLAIQMPAPTNTSASQIAAVMASPSTTTPASTPITGVRKENDDRRVAGYCEISQNHAR